MKKTSSSKSAFFNPRFFVGLILCSVGVLLALLAYTTYPGASVMAQKPSQQMTQSPGWQVGVSYHNDTSPPLREMATWPLPPSEGQHEANLNPRIPHHHIDRPDPVVQNKHITLLGRLAPNIPGPILSFNGIPFPGVTCNCAPPDTNGEVGATQYVQIVNKGYQVFNKFTGASVLGPVSIQSIWAGFGGPCQTGSGDPVVLYDQLADRWVITQFASTGVPTDECIAVSQTPDAAGAYHRYGFHLGSNFFDYPHLGVWPDAYYMSDNVFNTGGTAFLGTQAFAFDRAKMLCGLPATFITPGLTVGGSNNEAFLPADLDGFVLPPPGAPNSFVEFPDGGNGNTYKTWHFHVDFATPANSTFTVFAAPVAAPYTSAGFSDVVPQLGTTQKLDTLGDRGMFRSAYRNFGTPSAPNESLVGNYTVLSNGVTGVRWYEIRNVTNGPETVFQESTYQPDTTWRWMGSAAMDHVGNLAVGFSASSSSIFPQIRYAGRLVTDPINTLAQGEAHLFDGTGSEVGTNGRWGDYSDMTADPVNDTTMWYTTEYYETTSSFNWRTRIGSFRINGNTANTLLQTSAKSRLDHCGGQFGYFDIDLPLFAGMNGPGRGVECRRGDGSGGDYTILFNFTNPIMSVTPGTPTPGCATVTSTTINSPENDQVIVNLTAGSGCNGNYITVPLTVTDVFGNTIPASVTFGLLLGDTTGNGAVNAADINQTKAQSGMGTCPSNFRTDVNTDCIINASDIGLVKSQSGNTLPTPP